MNLAEGAEPAFGAPLLLAERLARAELDTALLHWNFAARLEVGGHRELSAVEVALGAAAPAAMLGHVSYERWAAADRPAVDGFLRASAAPRRSCATATPSGTRSAPCCASSPTRCSRGRATGSAPVEWRLPSWRTLEEDLLVVARAAGARSPPVEALLGRVGLEG